MILMILFIFVVLYILVVFYQKQMFRLFSVIAGPIVRVYIANRIRKGKEDPNRKNERFGIPSATRPEGKLIWIHAVSVGETLSIIPFVEEFKKVNEGINILLTTTTLTSAKLVENMLGDSVIHQFAPFDVFLWDRRFIKYWKPNAVFFVESELWPNVLFYLYEKDIPTYLLNVRISNKSLQRMYFAKKFLKISFFSLFTKVFVPSSSLKMHARDLGARDIEVIPNLKTISKKLDVNLENVKKLNSKIKDRKCWIAVSSHKGEEEIILESHKRLKEIYPNILTVIAIRHPNRGKEVGELFSKNGLSYCLYSENFDNDEDIKDDILIVNKIGVLGDFFETIPTVLVCGSLVEGIGGHNMLEPMKFMCNVATGEHIENFKDIYNYVENLCKKVSNSDEIKNFVDSSLKTYVRTKEVLDRTDFVKSWNKVVKQISKSVYNHI